MLEGALIVRSFLSFLAKCLLGLIISILLFIIFFLVQRFNYAEPDQVYLMGTKIGYLFVFLFFFMVTYFLLSFIKHRNNPNGLKRRFFIFSAIYMLLAPLVILSFDNYLIVTKKGLAYNRFFSLENEKIHSWKEIENVTLDYTVYRFPNKKPKVRFYYLVTFHNGTRIDLNNRNSPLFQAREFQAIHNVIKKHRIPIYIQKPFPIDLKELYPFYYELFQKDVQKSHQDDGFFFALYYRASS